MSESHLLTQDDIEAVTGAKQASRQSEVLDLNGIYYIKRLDGSIVTTWHHVNNPARKPLQSVSDMPDFSKVG